MIFKNGIFRKEWLCALTFKLQSELCQKLVFFSCLNRIEIIWNLSFLMRKILEEKQWIIVLRFPFFTLQTITRYIFIYRIGNTCLGLTIETVEQHL